MDAKGRESEPVCIDGEIPFEVPDGWEWARMGSLALKITDGTHHSPVNMPTGDYMYVTAKNIKDDGVEVAGITYVSKAVHEEIYKRCNPAIGDILLVKDGATTGVVTVNNIDQPFSLLSSVALIKVPRGLLNWFLVYYLRTDLFNRYIRSLMSGTGIPRITLKKIEPLLVPLPPLAEQRRIVAKVEELMPLVGEYGKLESEREALDANLPDRLRKSVLQEAVRGRLVPQDPSDEPASALLGRVRAERAAQVAAGKLKAPKGGESVIYRASDGAHYEKRGEAEPVCIEGEIPFEAPESWEWVRLGGVTTYISRGKSPKYSTIRKYPVVAQKCNQWSGFSLEKAKFIDPDTVSSYAEERLLRDGDLLWNSTGLGTLGRIVAYDSSVNEYGWAVADSHVTVIRTRPSWIDYRYALLYFSNPSVQLVIEDQASGSTKQKELSQETIRSYLFPLPPLAEQQRIVAKVEKLTTLTSQLLHQPHRAVLGQYDADRHVWFQCSRDP